MAVNDDGVREAHSLDAWPLAVKRARVERPLLPEAVATPRTNEEVVAILREATATGQPVVPWGAGSSVTGASLPVRGGLTLDLRGLDQVVELDEVAGTVTVQAGLMGGELERWLGERGFTTHFSPQSLHRSTVGGWVATRATGQLSSRWGGIEDLVVALTVVLADGRVVRLSDHPRAAHGPDIMRLFIGAEGTLGVVTEVTLRIFPAEELRELDSYLMPTVEGGVEAMRRMMREGLRPALMRLYDEDETGHLDGISERGCALLLGFTGAARLAEAEHDLARAIAECGGGSRAGAVPTEAWLARRYDFSRVESVLDREGGYAETIEVAHRWSGIVLLYRALKAALLPVADEVLGHFSHAYTQGTSLYVILTGQAADDAAATRRLEAIWERSMTTALEHDAAISHHHGIGLARAPQIGDALGSAWPLLREVKATLDPAGILNPGKLGLNT